MRASGGRPKAYVANHSSAPDCEVLNTARLGIVNADPMAEWGSVDVRPGEYGAVALNGARLKLPGPPHRGGDCRIGTSRVQILTGRSYAPTSHKNCR